MRAFFGWLAAIVCGVVLITAALGGFGGPPEDEDTETSASSSVSDEQYERWQRRYLRRSAREEKAERKAAREAREYQRKNAGKLAAQQAAQTYINRLTRSRQATYEELRAEGHSEADALWALDHIDASWKLEALELADAYLATDSYTRAEMIGLLRDEQFTYEEAAFAAWIHDL